MDIESEAQFNEDSVVLLIETLFNMEFQIGKVNSSNWTNLSLYYISTLQNRCTK